MRKFLFLYFTIGVFILSHIPVSAQGDIKKSTVELKDGSLLKGYIIKDADDHIRLIIETGDTLTIGYKNINNINSQSFGDVYNRKAEHKYDGMFYGLEYSQYIHEDAPFGFSLLVGKRLNRRTSLGVNVRLRRHKERVGVTFIDPYFVYGGAYLRRYISEAKVRLFTDATLGYTVSTNSGIQCCTIDRDYKGGVQVSIGGGIQIANDSPLSLIVKTGLTYSRTSGEINSIDNIDQTFESSYNKQYYIPYLSVGIEF